MPRALPVLLVALLVGCAPSSPGSSTPSAGTAKPSFAAPPAAAPRAFSPTIAAGAAPSLSELIAVSVGTSGDYPPLSIWKGDHAEGFAPEVVTAFEIVDKRSIRWTRFRWTELTDDLRERRFDIAADGITVRPEGSVLGRFTVPIARGGAVLLVRRPRWAPPASGDPKSVARALDRSELRIVVNQGGHLERFTRQLMHHASIRAIADNGAVREALARGEADAAMTNTFEAPLWAEGLSGIERVGPLSREVTALWVRPERGDIAERLDAWLLGEEESGRLDALRSKALAPGLPKTAEPVSAIFAAVAERLALMPFVAAEKKRTGKPIEDLVQEARVLFLSAQAVIDAGRTWNTPPPPRPLVEAFYRAQIEAAKRVQSKAKLDPSAPAFSLENDLRPAIARIDARLAFLLSRLRLSQNKGDERDVLAEAREALAESGLDTANVDALGAAVDALRSK
jgi:cyclohexadienyl dehydratase